MGTIEKVFRYILYILLLCLLAVPLILLIPYLRSKNKKIIFYPELKIVDIKYGSETDTDEKDDAVKAGEDLTKNL